MNAPLPTFGHPSADAVIDRYLTGKSSSLSTNDQLNMQQNNQYYSQLCREPETEKKKKESIEESKLVNNDGNDNNGGFWWNEPVDDMRIEELEEFMTALGELKKKVTMRADELNMINGSSSSNSTMQIARFGAALLTPKQKRPQNNIKEISLYYILFVGEKLD
ncbi:agamous-like MADS-box protein AGL61 [Lycium barbarum]|uniref:agamous-like MADS-box protein AGL61 n=1 Tax=Lycium barbarum TaxID=112863 RepID=UPI00293F45D1|nr:agamous-like MADS-box protein AGL61 [Lycium barbarum]